MKYYFSLLTFIMVLITQSIFGSETVIKLFGYIEDKESDTEFLVFDPSGKCNHQLHFDHLKVETQFEQPPEFSNTLVISINSKPILQKITLNRINRSFTTKDIAYNISKNGKAWGFEYEVDFDYPIEDGSQTLRIKAISVVIGQDVEGTPVTEYYLWPRRLPSKS